MAEDAGKNVVLKIDEFQKIRALKQPFPRSQESRNVEAIISCSETA